MIIGAGLTGASAAYHLGRRLCAVFLSLLTSAISSFDSCCGSCGAGNLPRGSVVVSEGGPGGSCFIIVRGSVDVTVRGSQQLLAELPAGSIFGQVSFISGEARTATCSMSQGGVILELERKPCETLLSAGSHTSLKFLGASNNRPLACPNPRSRLEAVTDAISTFLETSGALFWPNPERRQR